MCRRLLRPDQCVEKVERALCICPEITVVGVAGPGDSLASEHALSALASIHKKYPRLIKCMSTNGLMLARKAERILAAGVQTVSVTINGVDPNIVRQICTNVRWEENTLAGLAGAETLIEQQLLGIQLMSAGGVFVKVNTVLIPGVNDRHVGDVAAIAAANGASIINIIPLIPQHQMIDFPAPTCEQLQGARAAAERYLPVFRHCKHCRADAAGIPGQGLDFSAMLDEEPLAATFSHG